MNPRPKHPPAARRRARPRPHGQPLPVAAVAAPIQAANPIEASVASARRPSPRAAADLDRRMPPRRAVVPGELQPIRLPPAAQLDHVGATGLKTARPAPLDGLDGPADGVRMLRLETEDIDCIAELAYDYAISGAHEVARVLYTGLVALEPRVAHHRLGLGLALDRRGQTDAAREQFEIAAQLDPTEPTPLVNLAELRLAVGDRRRALSLLNSADSLRFDNDRLRTKIRSMIDIILQGARRE